MSPNFIRAVPEGEDRERDVCARCGFIAYQNPKIVVGSVVRSGERILLCRRAIEPRRGFWTLPAGYLELGETPEEGARREAREEACAELTLAGLLAVYTIRRLSQVQLIYRAELVGSCAAGPESLEVGLFAPGDIPHLDLAFPSVTWALAHERRAASGEGPPPFVNPPGETGDRLPRGSAPPDGSAL